MKDLQGIDALLKRGDFLAALQLAERLLIQAPRFELRVLAANAAIRLERFTTACEHLEAALRERPDFVPARRQLSQLLNRLGHQNADPAAAQILFDRALSWWPDNAAARFNLAQSRVESEPEGALQLLAALSADPDVIELRAAAGARLGLLETVAPAVPLQLAQGRDEVARENLQQLAWNSAPGTGRSLGLSLCRAQPAKVLARLTAELALPACHSSLDEVHAARQGWVEGMQRLQTDLTPAALQASGCDLDQLSWCNFLLAYQGLDDRALQSRYGDWLSAAAGALAPRFAIRPTGARRSGPRRIGLLSSFWRECTVGAYFAAWIGALRDADSEVFLLSLGPRFDHWTEQLEATADKSVRLSGPLEQIAAQIAALDLDLLLFPELGMDGRTMVLAALQLARSQACGWGHPVSSGLPGIDFFLSCGAMEPAEAAGHYRERLQLLPDLGTHYRLPARPPAVERSAFGLHGTGPLIVLPCSAFKLHPDTDADLAGLLASRPEARAVLLRTEPPGAMQRLQTRLERALTQAGAEPQRQLVWLPPLDRTRFLQLLGCADLMLDPAHWSGGNTALDAVHMGLPILTRRGTFMRGRQSAAMLDALGLGEHCVLGPSDDNLVQRAGVLLDQPELRREWRRELPGKLADWIGGSQALGELRSVVLGG